MADVLLKLRKIFYESHKVTEEGHVAQQGDLHERVASSMNDLESKSSELKPLPGLATETARF